MSAEIRRKEAHIRALRRTLLAQDAVLLARADRRARSGPPRRARLPARQAVTRKQV